MNTTTNGEWRAMDPAMARHFRCFKFGCRNVPRFENDEHTACVEHGGPGPHLIPGSTGACQLADGCEHSQKCSMRGRCLASEGR